MKAHWMSGSALIAIGVMASSPVDAQENEPPAGAETSGTEIVVTAQRRDEALQDVPIAVSAFTGDQLDNSNIDELVELSKTTPSLVVPEGGSQSVPYIRGVGGRNITPGNESTAAVYVDGVYLTDKTGILLQSFPEVDSIQVLRGPQGTLFGRNATSGAILINTRRPDDEFAAMAEASYGTSDRRARAYIAGPLAEGLAGSISGFYRYETPYITVRSPNTPLDPKTGDEEIMGIRAKLALDAGPLTAELQGNYIEGYTTAIMAMQPAPGSPLSIGEAVSLPLGIDIRTPPRSYYGEVDPETRYDTWGGSLKVNYDLGSVGLQSISAYTESGSGVQLDLDLSPVPVFFFDTDLKGRTVQQELLVSSQSNSAFQWLLGAFYINYRDGYTALDQFVGLNVPVPYRQRAIPQQLRDYSALGLGPTSGLAFIDQSSFVRVESIGAFADASYKVTDAATITLGVRYTDETHTLDESNGKTTYLPNGTGGLIAIPSTSLAVCDADPDCDGLSTPFSELTYRAVLDYEFSPDFLVYASYNRGFKSGVYNVSNITNIEATEPETIDAFEAGFKSQFLNRAMTLNVASYYYKYGNLQVPVVDPQTNTQKSINAAEATISGLEVEWAYRPNRRAQLSATFSTFFESEYDSFPNCEIYRPAGAGLALVSDADCSGEDLPVTPDIMASLSGSYIVPLAGDGEVEFAGLLSYIDEFDHATHGPYDAGIDGAGNPYPAGEGRAPIQESIVSLNASITFRPAGDTVYVTLWAEDLLDQNDRLFRNMQTTTFGYSTALGRGMSAGVTVGAKFGAMR